MKIAIGVVVVLVLVVLTLPLFVNADSFRPMLETQLSSALGRKVTLGKLSFSLLSGSVVADQLSVADDPAFSTQPFLQAKALKIGVDVGAFLFHHQVNIKKFVTESPEIHLISNEKGVWNYSSLGRSGSQSSQQSGPAPQLIVGVVDITDGRVIVSSIPANGNPFVYDAVNITVDNLSFGHVMPFSVKANLPGKGTVSLSGTVGPINQQDASATPVNAQLAVRSFDPVQAGVLPASAGIDMQADIEAQLKSDGKTASSTGRIVTHHLLLAKGGTPTVNPVNLTYKVDHDLQARTGQVKQLAVETGPVTVYVQGTYAMTGPATTVDLHLNATKIPVDAVESLLPAVGVQLPSGSQLKGGTLTAQLGITGTATAPIIAGPVEVDNTQLAGFDLGSKIQGLKALTGTSDGTAIQLVRADVRQTPAATQLSNINCVVPAIGSATGQGTVAQSGALNFQLTAKLSGTGAAGAAIDTAAAALGGVAGNLLQTAANASVPLTVTGTTSNPVIRADVRALMKGSLGTAAKKGLGNLLQGLVPK
ncbi:MAG: AsmA family protein [Acidobacteriota bacterium]